MDDRLLRQPRCLRLRDRAPGGRIYVSSAENRHLPAHVQADGTLGDLQPFAERGGESVAADAPATSTSPTARSSSTTAAGKPIGRIDVPERPIDILFGGPDRRTLFILTHHALYAVRVRG